MPLLGLQKQVLEVPKMCLYTVTLQKRVIYSEWQV